MPITFRQVVKQTQENLPKDAFGWILVLISLIMSVAIYVGRIQWRDTDSFASILCLPVICLFGLIFIFHTITLIRYAGKSRKFVPAIVLFGAAALSLFLPLPPTAEQTLFASYRVEYEELVQLAQSNQLPTNEECSGARGVYAYPPEYEHLRGTTLGTECIFVRTTPNVFVEFAPFDSYRPIVYFKNPAKIKDSSSACNGDGSILTKLNSNWFLCELDWN